MLSHAGHLCMKDIVPETFLGHESALDGSQRCGDELSLGLELAPEGSTSALKRRSNSAALLSGNFRMIALVCDMVVYWTDFHLSSFSRKFFYEVTGTRPVG